MGFLRRSADAATRTDPLASWGERAWKAVLWIFGPSLLSGAALTVLGWLIYNPLYGLLIGLAAFAIAQVGLTFNAIRKSAAQKGPMAQLGDPVSGNEAASDNSTSTTETGEDKEETNAVPEHLTDEELHKRFYAQSLKPIRGANFIDQRVPLDGFLYEQCTFERCTFVYRGEKPFGIVDFVLKGNDNNVEARDPGLHAFSRLLVALKYINPQIEVDKSLQVKDVAIGYRRVKDTDLRKLSNEELKQHCSDLADELHTFLEDHVPSETDRVEWMDVDDGLGAAKADTEAMRRFRKGPKKEVIGLLAELKQRGWWKQADFDLLDWEAVESLAHPRDLQIVANRLERLGYDF